MRPFVRFYAPTSTRRSRSRWRCSSARRPHAERAHHAFERPARRSALELEVLFQDRQNVGIFELRQQAARHLAQRLGLVAQDLEEKLARLERSGASQALQRHLLDARVVVLAKNSRSEEHTSELQ